jgi:hypothetical protein
LENGFLQKWPRVPEGQKLEFRKKILMFSVFLLISIVIWLLSALSKNYTAVIRYPLVYTDFPEDRVFVGETRESLELRVNAGGYALLRYKTFRRPAPISFNVSAFNLNRTGQDSASAFILTRYIRDQVSRQLPAELQLLEVSPDTLSFQFARKVTTKVKISPDLEFELDDRFTLKDGIRLEPDSVIVSGPDVVLDTLSAVYTEHLDLGLLTKSYIDKVRLQKMEEVELERSRVSCIIELERYTEVQLSVPIEVQNLPDSLSLQTFPSRIKFTGNVGLSQYDRIESSLIRAVVDYRDISDNDNVLDVKIMNVPVYLVSYDFYPRSVEFLLSR